RKLLSEVDFFFPASVYMADLLRAHGIEDQRIKVVMNGTDPERFYPVDVNTARRAIGFNGGKILLSVSRLVSKKGIDTTIRAFADVLKEHPDSCYIIVGNGEQEDELQQLASQLDITESIHFIGPVPHNHPNLINYYNACDV